MSDRYIDRPILTNDDELYLKILEKRHVGRMRQYGTAKFVYPSIAEIRKLNRVKHVWAVGDRYYKLADRHYGRTDLWWIIAFFNQKPTEANVKIGEVILIPLPLELILQYLEE
jgi:hypothetical protein